MSAEPRPSYAIKVTKAEDGKISMETFGSPSCVEVVALAEFASMLGKYDFAHEIRTQRDEARPVPGVDE